MWASLGRLGAVVGPLALLCCGKPRRQSGGVKLGVQ